MTRDGAAEIVRPNSQARTGTGNYSFSPVQLTKSRIGDHTRLVHTLLYMMTIHKSSSVLLSCFREGTVYKKT